MSRPRLSKARLGMAGGSASFCSPASELVTPVAPCSEPSGSSDGVHVCAPICVPGFSEDVHGLNHAKDEPRAPIKSFQQTDSVDYLARKPVLSFARPASAGELVNDGESLVVPVPELYHGFCTESHSCARSHDTRHGVSPQ